MHKAIGSGDLIKRIYWEGYFPDNYIVIDFKRNNVPLRVKYKYDSKEAIILQKVFRNKIRNGTTLLEDMLPKFIVKKEIIERCSALLKARQEWFEKTLNELYNEMCKDDIHTTIQIPKNRISRFIDKIKSCF